MFRAAAPNSKTDAKTNVSETEILDEMDGTLIVKEPVRSVRAASEPFLRNGVPKQHRNGMDNWRDPLPQRPRHNRGRWAEAGRTSAYREVLATVLPALIGSIAPNDYRFHLDSYER